MKCIALLYICVYLVLGVRIKIEMYILSFIVIIRQSTL